MAADWKDLSPSGVPWRAGIPDDYDNLFIDIAGNIPILSNKIPDPGCYRLNVSP